MRNHVPPTLYPLLTSKEVCDICETVDQEVETTLQFGHQIRPDDILLEKHLFLSLTNHLKSPTWISKNLTWDLAYNIFKTFILGNLEAENKYYFDQRNHPDHKGSKNWYNVHLISTITNLIRTIGYK